MEGRSSPPPAEHPFIDDPTPINKKFWGTPASRGFFRYGAVFITGWMSLLVLHYQLTKHDMRVLGYDINMTEEQRERRKQILSDHPIKRSIDFGATFITNQGKPDKDKPKGYEMRFDDNVRILTQYRSKPIQERIER